MQDAVPSRATAKPMLAALALCLASSTAFADNSTNVPDDGAPAAATAPAITVRAPDDGAPSSATEPAIRVRALPTTADEAASWHGAHFSVGRWVVEMLVGATVGTLSSILVYNAAGGDVGGALAGIATSFVITPLAEWGVGNLMGGHGSLGFTYTGGLIGFSAATPAAPNGALLTLAIAEICLPITSGLFYEITSNKHAQEWENAHGLGVSVMPLPNAQGNIGGAGISAALRF